MKLDSPQCIYCFTAIGETGDHVPPKSFFPKPRPNNLITVPACLKCNQDSGKDEDYFVATLMFSDAGVTKAGQTLWKQRLRRMYDRNPGLRRRIASSMQRRELVTPAGLSLGRKMTLQYDPERLESTASKIVRGLYYHENGQSLEPRAEVVALFMREKAHFEAVGKLNHMLKPGASRWHEVFEYRYAVLPTDPLQSVWLLHFWRTHLFWAITAAAHLFDESRDVLAQTKRARAAQVVGATSAPSDEARPCA